MITPPKPGQALDIYTDFDAWLPGATPWPPKLRERLDPLEHLRSRALDAYELRPVSYELRPVSYMTIMQLGVISPYRHGSFSTDPGYWCETDTEIDWEDRANADGGNPDWWSADWVREAIDKGLGPQEHCGGCSCDPFGDSFDCQDDCEGCDGCV